MAPNILVKKWNSEFSFPSKAGKSNFYYLSRVNHYGTLTSGCNRSLRFSGTLLGILANLSNYLVQLLEFPVFSVSFPCFYDYSDDSNDDWYHSHFDVPLLFNSFSRSSYLWTFSLSFIFTLLSTRTVKSTRRQFIFFLIIKTGFGLLVWIG